MSVNMQQRANRLINEKSPYLLQHAYNPVDWFPWCEETFTKAKVEDKPIFLSIGYSTCHWCHVMERESFEDEEVAGLLKKHFISIKVDREERPDIDSLYMSFCQALTGQGGWPLTIIMTPDKKPFYAGTYFPKISKYGRAGLMDILEKIGQMWKEKREDIEKSSKDIYRAVSESVTSNQKSEMPKEIIHETFSGLKDSFDLLYGGFGNAPKFPTPHNLSFLLRYFKSNKKEEALKMVEKTLEQMYKGGIFDHIGFGFSRYSTDEKWLVPHFEKMLYDNALLAISYLEAYQLTQNNRYKKIVEKIFTYILRDMTSKEGGFYCAEDADSEGIEGKFYVWDAEEILRVLGNEDGKLFCKYYDITDKGNFEGKSIPNLIHTSLEDIENNKGLEEKLEYCREKLFEHRLKRIHPHKDDKILTSWNGLMIAALSYGGRVLNNKKYIDAAKKATDFVLKSLTTEDKRLLARFRDGQAAYIATIDDYAFLIWGLIELYEAIFDTVYLEYAINLNNDMLTFFWDEEKGGLFISSKDSEELVLRTKDIYDGATPSGNSVATINMLRLARITEDKELEEKALSQFDTFGGNILNNPNAYTHFMMAFVFANMPPKEIVLAGEINDKDINKMVQKINSKFLPFTTVVLNNRDEALYKLVPSVKDKDKKNSKATAYVCENFTCSMPTTDLQEFVTHL